MNKSLENFVCYRLQGKAIDGGRHSLISVGEVLDGIRALAVEQPYLVIDRLGLRGMADALPEIGSQWLWAPDSPRHRAHLEVEDVRWNGEEWRIYAFKTAATELPRKVIRFDLDDWTQHTVWVAGAAECGVLMRRMSFALTTAQIRARTKTVTRRLGWRNLRPGDRIAAVEKAMGFRKGEKAPPPIAVLEVVSVRREVLADIDRADVAREGFPGKTPLDFLQLFCAANDCQSNVWVQRIEFRYVEGGAGR